MIRKIFVTPLFLFINFPLYSQNIELGFGAGYSEFLAPTKYVERTSNLGYGFHQSYPVLISTRYISADKKISFLATLVYESFSGRGYLPPSINGINSLKLGEIENKGSIWSTSVGVQWPVLVSKFSPHLIVEFLIASFSEITSIQGTPQGNVSFSEPSKGVRCGMSIGGGFNVPFLFNTSLDFDAKYVMHSLFGRTGGEKSVNSFQLAGIIFIPI